MKFAKRLLGISPSSTMTVMLKAQQLRDQGVDVIDLSVGEPDFDTPDSIKLAGIEAIRENFTKYTSAAGILELRQVVAEKFNRECNGQFSAANVMITCGAKHAIYNTCLALFESGNEVLIPVPYWVTFPEVIKMSGALPKKVMTYAEDGFVLQVKRVREQLSSKTSGVVFNTPNNPTGAVAPVAILRELVDLCRERDIFLLSDETYEYLTYGDEVHTSVASLIQPSDSFYAVVGSLSKTYAMTGWRIGFCVSHPARIEKMSAFQSHQTGNPTSISQWAAVSALKSGTDLVKPMQKEYQSRREFVISALEEIPGFSCALPSGTFYAFPDVSACMKMLGVNNSEELADFLIQEAAVAVVPGSAFGLEGYIRISYATSIEKLKEAFSRIRRVVSDKQ